MFYISTKHRFDYLSSTGEFNKTFKKNRNFLTYAQQNVVDSDASVNSVLSHVGVGILYVSIVSVNYFKFVVTRYIL